jgi:hypothetical protein
MPALKAVVIVMGLLILSGIAVIAFTIVNRAGEEAEEKAVERIVRTGGIAPAGLVGFGAIRLEGAEGCRIVESAADSGRLVLRTEGAGAGCGRVHIIDLATGQPLGTIEAGGAN